MEKLVETIAKYLVDSPDQISVQDIGENDNSEEVLQLSVSSDDMGKVIGKQGRIAKALRTVVKAAATKAHRQVNVEIVSNEEMAEAANAADPEE
jgi:predicted RNA-binding protein YlqC (UPF0109 family)